MNLVFEKRLNWVDISKGIGILLVLIGHNFGNLKPIIYSFHIPLFYILSGFVIKKIEKKDFLDAEIKDFKRLILTCVIARIIVMIGNCLLNDANIITELKNLLVSLLCGNQNCGTLIPMPVSIGRIWFLVSLFWARLFYRLFLLKFNANIRFIIIFISAIINIFMGIYGIILPHNFDLLFIGMLFIEIGYQLKDFDFSKISKLVMICLLVFWFVSVFYFGTWISMNERSYPGYIWCILVSISACICVFELSMYLEKFKISNILIFFGKNSMALLIANTFEQYFLPRISISQKITNIILECMITIIYVYMKNVLLKNWQKVIK